VCVRLWGLKRESIRRRFAGDALAGPDSFSGFCPALRSPPTKPAPAASLFMQGHLTEEGPLQQPRQMPLTMRSSAAFSRLIGSNGSSRFFSSGT
jgi:hypothetical protein